LTKGVDEIDKKILLLLSENPEVSQADLAENLKISQPAVSLRVRKLKEAGLLAHLIGMNAKKTQLSLGRIDINTNHPEQVLNLLNKCPLYLNSFLNSGGYNLTVLLIGENMRSIASCVDSHLRPDPIIKEMEFNFVVTPIRDFIVPIKPNLDKKKITPCEKDCSKCVFYVNNRCLGCPASIHYKGTLL